jgi:PAS domain S-box-containing protein
MQDTIRVLLVEDNPGDARLLREAVADATQAADGRGPRGSSPDAVTSAPHDPGAAPGLQWVVVERLSDALCRLREEPFDVLLLDLSLPDAHGYETFTQAYGAAPDVPIVVLTGLDDEELAVRTVQAGAQDYLVKADLNGHLVVRAVRYAIERRRAMQALRESERRFRAIFDQTFQFIGLLSPDGTVLEANQAALSYIGATQAEVVHRPFWAVPWWTHDPGVQERLRRDIEEAARGQFIRREVVHVGADGVPRPFDFSLKPVTNESGEVVLLIPEGRDISARKRAEEELRRQNEELAAARELVEAERRRYRDLFEFAPDGYLVTDAEGVIREANQAAATLLDATQETLVGNALSTFVDVEERADFHARLDRLLQVGRVPDWEVCLRPAGGHPFDASLTVAAVRDPGDRPVALRWLVRDITDRKRAEEERARLLVSEREKSEQLKLSVREAHHRIKNNLQAISDLIYLELAGGESGSPEEALRGSIERIQAIATVHDLLSQDEDVRVVDARAVLDRLVPMVLQSSGLPANVVTLTVKVPSVPLSSKRATALALIVNELVSNAAKHAFKDGRKGEVTVSLQQESEELVLRVRDNGPGLPAGFALETHSHVGLDVVRTLAEHDLNGTFSIDNREGVLAEVRFVW